MVSSRKDRRRQSARGERGATREGVNRSDSIPATGVVMIGCQNVRRIATAAANEFILGTQVVFKSIRGGIAQHVLAELPGAVTDCQSSTVELVLHVGGNDIGFRSVEYTLDCIAEIVKQAKQIGKVS